MGFKDLWRVKQVMVFLYFLIVLCNPTPFNPIQAGTFYITARDLVGASNKTIKQVQLQTPWQTFNPNLDIDIVCAFSSVNIDERVSFQFTYKLADKIIAQGSSAGKRNKIILVQITDKNGFIYEQLRLGVDFLIAQNLRTQSYNATSFQQHLMNQSLTEDQADKSNKEVHNQLFLYPNGFSSFNLTHNFQYNYVTTPYDMYTIHYMAGAGHEHMEQGWVTGKDFIYFRYVLYPRYPYGYKQCGAVYETQLLDDFYFQCDKKGIDSYFYGLMGYQGARFEGQFTSSKTGFSFHISHIDQGKKYNVIGFPFKINDKFKFIDNRKRSLGYFLENESSSYLFIALGILIVAIITIVVVILRRKKLIYFDLQQQKPLQSHPSTSSYKTSPKRNGPQKRRNSGKLQQKTSDQEMKQEQLHRSQVFNLEQKPKHAFN